jgi:hypothetical protein
VAAAAEQRPDSGTIEQDLKPRPDWLIGPHMLQKAELAVSVHTDLALAAAAKPVKEAGEYRMASLLVSALTHAISGSIHGAIVARSDL